MARCIGWSPDERSVPDPLTILYIAGYARTGSTVLDNVLAQAPGVTSVGELRWIWKQGFIDGGFCGCGLPVSGCPFWHQVLSEAFGAAQPCPEDLWKILRRHLRNRPRSLLQLSTSRVAVHPDLRRYIETITRIYRAAASVTGANIVIDSSKTPIEPLGLIALSDLRIRIVHLVRDPRAVAFSMMRAKDAPDRPARGVMGTMTPWQSSARWTFANWTILNRLSARNPEASILCRYEDFVADPEAVLAAISRFAGIGEPPRLKSGRQIETRPVHGPAGNPDRLSRKSVTIRPDERWRSQMSMLERLQATAPAAPLMRRFSYPLSA